MTTSPQPDRVTAIYNAIDAFQREHRTGGGLQHAQIRALLAEHLADALPAVSAAAPSTDRAELGQRIAEAVKLTLPGVSGLACAVVADAVMSILPAPVDRAAVRDALRRADEAETRAAAMERAMESTAADALRHRGCHRDLMAQCQRAERAEAEVERRHGDRAAVLEEAAEAVARDRAETLDRVTQIPSDRAWAIGNRHAEDLLRRLAAEARATTQADEAPETDEERADREETERDHARGDHTYCGITCEVEMPTEHLRNFVIAKGYPGTKGALDELLRRAAAAPQPATTQADTLPAWLYQRFMPDGTGWDNLDEDDRSYWEHHARAVRRAVVRGGFKQPTAPEPAEAADRISSEATVTCPGAEAQQDGAAS